MEPRLGEVLLVSTSMMLDLYEGRNQAKFQSAGKLGLSLRLRDSPPPSPAVFRGEQQPWIPETAKLVCGPTEQPLPVLLEHQVKPESCHNPNLLHSSFYLPGGKTNSAEAGALWLGCRTSGLSSKKHTATPSPNCSC